MNRLLFLVVFLTVARARAGETLSFNRDVRPILSDKCFSCHGFDPKARKADRRIDTPEGATAEKDGVRAIVPGDLKQSEAWQRIISDDKDEVMPPPKSHKTLTAAEKETIKNWIGQGAQYQKHWAFLPPERAALPDVSAQFSVISSQSKKTSGDSGATERWALNTENWKRNPIDALVLKRLAKEGLKPSPETAPETWLRRASLDLTGLPPTPGELDAFVADAAARGEKAYADAADRLLASKHFGERLAIDWLDAARYADTYGFNNDAGRPMWRWRDWVINAFNANMPYDRFITEQLAGDLLPNPTLEQRIATGFSRNNVISSEGGIIDEEYRVEYVADRVRTMSTAWLGLTTECSRCHDHKFDPLTQRDYYSFFAFFNNVPEHGEDGRNGVAVPMIAAPTEAQQTLLAVQNRAMSDLSTEIAKVSHDLPSDDAALKNVLDAAKATAGTLKSVSFLDEEKYAEPAGGGIGLPTDKPLEVSHKKFDFESKEGASITFWIRVWPGNPADVPILSALDHTGSPADARFGGGRELRLINGELEWRESLRLPVYARIIRTEYAQIARGEWHHVALSLGAEKTVAKMRVFLDGEEVATQTRYDGHVGGVPARDFLVGADDAKTGEKFRGQLDAIRFFPKTLSGNEVRALALAESMPQNVQSRMGGRLRHMAMLAANEATQVLEEERMALWEKHLALERSFPMTMVMEELPKPRQAYVLIRGNYETHGEAVSPGVPEQLIAPWPDGAPRNRLGLAQWFTQPRHPLTSRVVVNRFWAQLFGTGIVKTLEDFGAQGEWPSHPELLDWLARDFVDGGWNVKALLKEMVLSATYRQSSAASASLVARDPENRLLARGPRVRLPAEIIRDQALAVSGLLAPRIGGPSVFPYQPEKLYEGITVDSTSTGTRWTQGKGEDLYRRSIYTFWKRTVPHPAMLTLDMPDREVCTVRRSRTNTPLQALLLWNEPGYLEAARLLGTRMLREGGATSAAQVSFAFRLATGRQPTRSEVGTLLAVQEKLHDDFASKPADAEAFLKVGESPVDASLPALDLAASMGVASMILNLDETITKN